MPAARSTRRTARRSRAGPKGHSHHHHHRAALLGHAARRSRHRSYGGRGMRRRDATSSTPRSGRDFCTVGLVAKVPSRLREQLGGRPARCLRLRPRPDRLRRPGCAPPRRTCAPGRSTMCGPSGVTEHAALDDFAEASPAVVCAGEREPLSALEQGLRDALGDQVYAIAFPIRR